MHVKPFVSLLRQHFLSIMVLLMMLSPLLPSASEGQVIDTDSVSTNNDTMATAQPLGLSAAAPRVTVEGQFAQRFEDPLNTCDATEDVDMYSVELQAGDRITIDADSVRFPFDGILTGTSPDLHIFDAEGEELVYVRIAPAPNEFFTSDRDAYVDFTAELPGIYYIGASHYRNETYDPEIARSGAGRIQTRTAPGAYTLDIALNPTGIDVQPFEEYTGPPPAGPVVSFVTTTGTFVQGNDILSGQLIELPEDAGSAILDLTFRVAGDIPEGGLEVILKCDPSFAEVFEAPTTTPGTAIGGELLGAIFNADGTVAGIRARLTASNSRFPFFVLPRDTDDPNVPDPVTFTLANSPAYVADPAAATSTVLIYDTLEQVQAGGGPIPQVGISINQTVLIETENTEVTLSVIVTGDIPADGLLTYIAAEQTLLGDFDVFNAVVTGGAFPAPNNNASGFFFRVFENNASITLRVFDETTNPQIPPEDALEGVEAFTLSVIANEAYTIDPAAASVSFTILDNPESVPLPPDNGGEEPVVPGDNDTNIAHDDTISTAVPTLLGLVPTVLLEGAIEQRWNLSGPSVVDNTEDVDMFSFILPAGAVVAVDLDSIPFVIEGIEQRMNGILRVFDAAGQELLINVDGAAPGEEPNNDAYLEFTVPAPGVYYVAVSHYFNDNYNPLVSGSGDGVQLIAQGISPGPYTLELTLLAGM